MTDIIRMVFFATAVFNALPIVKEEPQSIPPWVKITLSSLIFGCCLCLIGPIKRLCCCSCWNPKVI